MIRYERNGDQETLQIITFRWFVNENQQRSSDRDSLQVARQRYVFNGDRKKRIPGRQPHAILILGES